MPNIDKNEISRIFKVKIETKIYTPITAHLHPLNEDLQYERLNK